MKDKDKAARLLLVFALAVILLNYPLLGLVGRDVLVGGVPQLYAYLFWVWLLLIILTAALVSGRGSAESFEDNNEL
jgi:hypothetical protein